MTNKEIECIEQLKNKLSEYQNELTSLCDKYDDANEIYEDFERIRTCLEIVLEMVQGQDDNHMPKEILADDDFDVVDNFLQRVWGAEGYISPSTKYLRRPESLTKLKKALGGE